MSKKNNATIYIFSVLLAGFLWGSMGFFTRKMASFGIGSEGAIILRSFFSAILFAIAISFHDKRDFHVQFKHWWCFIGTGILSGLFFTYCYFRSINVSGLSIAAVLLYTAPAFVCILSTIFFGEGLGQNKIIAIVLAFAGCALVSGIGSSLHISALGLRYGLCSGFGYALYSIFSRTALNRHYAPFTINFYSCLFMCIGAIIVFRPAGLVDAFFASKEVMLWTLAMAFVSCVLPYFFYTYGLTGLENGKASILASVEPVVATFIGFTVFHERLTVESLIGMFLVLIAIILINRKGNR